MRKCNVCHSKTVISIRVPKMLMIQQKLRTKVLSSLNGNWGIKTSKNPLLHKSNKNTGKNCQHLYFHNSGNYTKTCNNSKSFYSRKMTISVKRVSFVTTYPILIILSQLHSSLEKKAHNYSKCKTTSLAVLKTMEEIKQA